MNYRNLMENAIRTALAAQNRLPEKEFSTYVNKSIGLVEGVMLATGNLDLDRERETQEFIEFSMQMESLIK